MPLKSIISTSLLALCVMLAACQDDALLGSPRKAAIQEVTIFASPVPARPRPSANPSASPLVFQPPTSPAPSPGGAGSITIQPAHVLRAACSHLLGVCRNHVGYLFDHDSAKLEAMKALTPTWGDRKYLYRIGHGITDGRTDYSYMTGFHFENCWNQVKDYPYDDLRDSLREADAMGCDQIHVINFGTGTPEEAGRYVSYLNHAGDANRARYPIAQQNVRLFEIGNEIAWSAERGHDQYAPDESAYAQRAKQFARAMRENSDVPIQIGAVGSINSNWLGNGWSGGATTVKNILGAMGDQVDFLIFHGYPSWPMLQQGNLLSMMAQNEWNRQKLDTEIQPAIQRYGGGRDIYLADTEFFSNLYSDPMRARGMFGAVYAADSVILAMNENIRVNAEFCLGHQDMADSAFFLGGDASRPTAIYKFQALLAHHWGDQIIEAKGLSIPSEVVKGAAASITMPLLSYAAAKSQDGSTIYLLVANRTPDRDVSCNIQSSFAPGSAIAYTLSGPAGWDSDNGSVSVEQAPALLNHCFKRSSITLLEFHAQRLGI